MGFAAVAFWATEQKFCAKTMKLSWKIALVFKELLLFCFTSYYLQSKQRKLAA